MLAGSNTTVLHIIAVCDLDPEVIKMECFDGSCDGSWWLHGSNTKVIMPGSYFFLIGQFHYIFRLGLALGCMDIFEK